MNGLHSRSEKGKMFNQNKNRFLIVSLCIDIISFLILLVVLLLEDVSNAKVYYILQIIKNLALTSFLMPFIFIKKIRPYNFLYVGVIPLIWLTFFLCNNKDSHIIFLAYFSLIFFSSLVLVIIKNNKVANANMFIMVFFIFCGLLVDIKQWNFTNETSAILLLYGLILGLIITLILIIDMIILNKRSKIFSSKKDLISCSMGILVLCIFIGIGLVDNINYTLDNSLSQTKECEIIDKEIKHYHKSTSYRLIIYDVQEQQEVELYVKSFIYDDLHIGDTIEVAHCEGFLNVDYYIYLIDGRE